jgi:hypothetical protein
VTAAEALDEGVANSDPCGGANLFQSAHRSQPGLQPGMIGFDAIIGVLLCEVRSCWDQLIDYSQVQASLVRGQSNA